MNTPAIFEYYTLLPHYTEPLLLLIHTEKGWSLPHWQTTEQHFWQSCEHINLTIRDLLQLDVITLRCLQRDTDARTGRSLRIHELENRDAHWRPPHYAAWISQDDLADLQLAQPAHRHLMDAWFSEQRAGIPPHRRAWARVGWFDETICWITENLQTQSISVSGEVQQIRTWERSCLLRVPTSRGQAYCKAVPAMFAHELSLTHYLGTYHPAHAPSILAIDHNRRLMLMRDFGGLSLAKSGSFEQWEQAVRTLASLQREMAAHPDHLAAMGCPTRSLADLAEDIKHLLADTGALYLDGRGLTIAQITTLRSQLPQFLNLCQELSSYSLPDTVEHGDFSPANVARVAHLPLFYDWSDASVTHPFFNMWIFPEIMQEAYPTISDWQQRQQIVYLEQWRDSGSMEQLQRAFEIAQRLAPLHHASRYHRFVLPHMETKWEMELMIPYYLGKI